MLFVLLLVLVKGENPDLQYIDDFVISMVHKHHLKIVTLKECNKTCGYSYGSDGIQNCLSNCNTYFSKQQNRSSFISKHLIKDNPTSYLVKSILFYHFAVTPLNENWMYVVETYSDIILTKSFIDDLMSLMSCPTDDFQLCMILKTGLKAKENWNTIQRLVHNSKRSSSISGYDGLSNRH